MRRTGLERAQQAVVPQERGDRRALSHRVVAAAVPARGVDHVLTKRKDIGALPVQVRVRVRVGARGVREGLRG